VEKQITEEVRKGDLEAAENLGDVQFFPERQLASADNPYSHQELAERVRYPVAWILLRPLLVSFRAEKGADPNGRL
jgi:hypothetical protein